MLYRTCEYVCTFLQYVHVCFAKLVRQLCTTCTLALQYLYVSSTILLFNTYTVPLQYVNVASTNTCARSTNRIKKFGCESESVGVSPKISTPNLENLNPTTQVSNFRTPNPKQMDGLRRGEGCQRYCSLLTTCWSESTVSS